MSVKILTGDCRDVLRTLADESVHCIVTSPPYMGLRSYLPDGHANKAKELGTEPSPDAYVAELVAVFREAKRVLRRDGCAWINLGDCFIDKQLQMIPARVALALQADGWWLRSDIIWAKPNPMPESIQGSHCSKHMIKVADYERLSGLQYTEVRSDPNRPCDMSELSTGEIPNCETPLPEQRKRKDIDPHTGRADRCDREAETCCHISTGSDQQCEISQDAQGKGRGKETVGQLSRATRQRRGANNGSGLDDHSGASQASLLLLQTNGEDDARPCDPTKQRGSELAGECRPGVPFVQLHEEGPHLSDLLVHCPGCLDCINGYIGHLSAGRPTKAHEYLFLLTKSPSYYYDAEAIAEAGVGRETYFGSDRYSAGSGRNDSGSYNDETCAKRNKRSVWTIATAPFAGSHFAVMPPDLIEPCIKAGTSEKGCCAKCGAPWKRIVEKGEPDLAHQRACGGDASGGYNGTATKDYASAGAQNASEVKARILAGMHEKVTTGWLPSCKCEAAVVSCTVLDPFGGAGTTALVADRLQRNAIIIELNESYASMARRRIEKDAGMFAVTEAA